MNILKTTTVLFFMILCSQCQQEKAPETAAAKLPDPHSFSKPEEALTKHLDLNLKVDFDQKILSGFARWTISAKDNATEIVFDTRDLGIQKVTVGAAEKETTWTLAEPHPIFGSALTVRIEPKTEIVTIYYATRPEAAALGWMDPAQTAGKKRPFLFTQGQAILTRTWIPCQDSPGIRITYNAAIETPVGMMALMSAENPQQQSPDGKYTFRMEQPVSPYLIALAVGELAFQAVGNRTGVYAEPKVLPDAAWEFADMEKMLVAAESLYGPYAWGRYDLVVLPPGFPFGGMENPRLTFATPTVITHDRALVSLVAHELAHSWSGNLVTNATWNDFWLNEGFTVYFERRIMEALYGKDYTNMLALLEYGELEAEIKDLGANNPDTRLKLDLENRDPDEGVTSIAYQKGALFLHLLEEKVGRGKFDAFLKQYFKAHEFQTMTTEKFLEYLKANLPETAGMDATIQEWVFEPGLPANAPKPESNRLSKAESAAQGATPSRLQTVRWTSHEWVHYIKHLPDTLNAAALGKIDQAFNFTRSGNAEILCVWYDKAIRQGYSPLILPEIEAFLIEVGRRRFLMPIYKAFKESGQVETARRIFEKAKPGYHSVSRNSVEELLKNS